jgi:putative tryptophan/tyrosine transport system substrate-binding protein
MTRRRIGLLITLAVTFLGVPLAAAAPPPGKVARLAFLSAGSPARPSMPTAILDAFRQGLHELGWRYGQNLVVEYRWAEWRFERLPSLATELVQRPVDLLLVGSGLELLAAQQATRTIPIVMMLSLNAVEQGFVASLAQPGANVTGVTAMTADLNQKRLELLKELVPGSGRMAVLACQDPAPGQDLRMPAAQGWEAMQRTARTLGVHLQYLEVRQPDDYHEAFAAAIKERAEAMVVFNCYFHVLNSLRVLTLAAVHRLPAIYYSRDWVQGGGLMSYGPSLPDLARRAATYVDKILKGAKPADLPVEQPTTFELVINLKTAQALGLTIPPTLLFQATDVIR